MFLFFFLVFPDTRSKALVYAVWPRGASKQPIYDELACATAQAIDMAVYNEEMGTLRGYLALVNASLTNYIETTQQNGNGCADLTEALQYLSGAAYYMQGLQLAATAKGGAMMPLLLTLSYAQSGGVATPSSRCAGTRTCARWRRCITSPRCVAE